MSPHPETHFYRSLVQALRIIAERLERSMAERERGGIPTEPHAGILQCVQIALHTVEDALKSETS